MRNLLRAAGLVALFAVCSLMTSVTSSVSAAPGYGWRCDVDCCQYGWSASGFGDSVDEAWQNVTCEGHGGMCGTIECEEMDMQ